MKSPLTFNTIAAIAILFLNQNALAYSNDSDKKAECKPPKMLEFTLQEYLQPERLEVRPESEFSFKLSGGTPAEKIQVTAKDKPLAIETKRNTSFTLIKGKLPPELTGQFVRLNVIVNTELGCISRDGWLVKVAAQ